MPQGLAIDLGTHWWRIADDGGKELARFDHRMFEDIRNGAAVTYFDANGDGIAENVQPTRAVARYLARANRAGVCDAAIEGHILHTIMAALHSATGDQPTDRRKRLRRLRARIDDQRP